jgi:hypothetical protein
MLTVLVTLLADGRSPALGHLIQVTADLLFSAAKFPQTLLDLFDGRGRVYGLECVVVLFHGGLDNEASSSTP